MKDRHYILLLILVIFNSCGGSEERYPMSKRYWTPSDYNDVTAVFKFGIQPDEKLPTLNDNETKDVFNKYIDHENFKIVLDDESLGQKHRRKVAEDFFYEWRDMLDVYSSMDRQDRYIYDLEMLEVYQFGLDLQVRYFQLGNDVIISEADDPGSNEVVSLTNRNISSLIGNYLLYLDKINNEDSFSEQGINLYAKGIREYFLPLIDNYPDADYSKMLMKIDLMDRKSNSEVIKEALQTLKDKIEKLENSEITFNLETSLSVFG